MGPRKKKCREINGNDQVCRRSSRISRLSEGSSIRGSPSIRESKGMKRKPPDENPKEKRIQKKSKDGREIDSYCWICHKLGQDEICSTCPRVYHSFCLNKSNQFSQEGACAECQLESMDGTKLSKSLTCRRLKELLSFAAQKVFAPKFNEPAFLSWPESPSNDKLFHIMDMEILVDKLNDGVPYTKTAEFYSDVKWIHHNCCILFGNSAVQSQAAARLLRDLRLELQDIEACPQCYYNKYSETITVANYFIKICEEPHTLLWAKLKGFPYWPAKCLKVISGIADVRFFGTHDRSRIPVNKCYLLSESSPTKKTIKQVKYTNAMEELADYIANYKKKYGSFYYAPLRTIFCPGKACQLLKTNNEKAKATRSSAVPPVKRAAPAADLNDAFDDNCTHNASNICRAEGIEHSVISGIHSAATISSDNISRNPNFIGISSESITEAPTNAVSVCMTFSTDDEGNSELHPSETIISSSSLPVLTALHTIPDPVISETSSVQDILSSSSEINECELDDCENKLGLNINAVSSSDVFIMPSELSAVPNSGTHLNLATEENSILGGPIISHISDSHVVEESYRSPIYSDESASCTAVQVIENSAQKKAIPEVIVIDDDDDDDVIFCNSRSDSSSRQLRFEQYCKVSEDVYESMSYQNVELYNFLMEARVMTERFYFHLWSVMSKCDKSPRSFSQRSEIQNLQKHVKNILKKNEELGKELREHNIIVQKKAIADNMFNNLQKNIESDSNKKLQMAMEESKNSLSAQKKLEAEHNAKLVECEQLRKAMAEVEQRCSVLENELKSKNNKSNQDVQTNLSRSDILDILNKEKLLESLQKDIEDKEMRIGKKREEIIEAKKSDWCIRCMKPARIHCCLNTNYCDQECKRKHWKTHRGLCKRSLEMLIEAPSFSAASNEIQSSSNIPLVPDSVYSNMSQQMIQRNLNISISESVTSNQYNNLLITQGPASMIPPILFAQPPAFLAQPSPSIVSQHAPFLNTRNPEGFIPLDLISKRSER